MLKIVYIKVLNYYKSGKSLALCHNNRHGRLPGLYQELFIIYVLLKKKNHKMCIRNTKYAIN